MSATVEVVVKLRDQPVVLPRLTARPWRSLSHLYRVGVE
jgi:hypothetical protein